MSYSIDGEGTMTSMEQILVGNITIPPNPWADSGVNTRPDTNLVRFGAGVVTLLFTLVFVLVVRK